MSSTKRTSQRVEPVSGVEKERRKEEKGLEELMLMRSRKGLSAARDAELAIDIVDVCFHRADAHNHPVGNLLVRQPLGNQAEDLEFTLAQRLGKVPSA